MTTTETTEVLPDDAKTLLVMAYRREIDAMPRGSTLQDFVDAKIGKEGELVESAYLYDHWRFSRLAEQMLHEEAEAPRASDDKLPGVETLREALSHLDTDDKVAHALDTFVVKAMFVYGKFSSDADIKSVVEGVKYYRPDDFDSAIGLAQEVRDEVCSLMREAQMSEKYGDFHIQDGDLVEQALRSGAHGSAICEVSYNELVARVLAKTICEGEHAKPYVLGNLLNNLLNEAPYDRNAGQGH